jgi:hypothetical protein
MSTIELAREIVAAYERHGWNLRRVLLRPETKTAIESADVFGGAELRESDFDALWFARESHANREAWELRLMSQQSYALLEAFEADEAEEDREEARHEMENRMRAHATRAVIRGPSSPEF